MFRAIASDDFPPLGKFRMDFPPVENKPAELAEVHLLTGVNGTGKTRLLAVLAAMLGSNTALKRRLKGTTSDFAFYATGKPGVPQPLGDWRPTGDWGKMTAPAGNADWPRTHQQVLASPGGAGRLRSGLLPAWASQVPAFAYNGTAYVSDAAIAVMAGVKKPERAECLSFSRSDQHSGPLLQAIANLKVQAAMDSINAGVDQTTSRSNQMVRTLESSLTEITGHLFAFHVTTYPQPSLLVKWANAELSFDLLPDGLRSIIGWIVDAVVMMDTWLQGKGKLADTEAVFLLDEVESHLHPVWQRRILPAFQRLFPKAQIFVATHSPFVISSLTHGWIHPLSLEKDGKVKVLEPVRASAGDSYISVVEDIMGLAEWYDPETEKLLAEFRAERERAYKGSAEARGKAVRVAQELSARSMELSYVMGRELNQMERQLAKVETK